MGFFGFLKKNKSLDAPKKPDNIIPKTHLQTGSESPINPPGLATEGGLSQNPGSPSSAHPELPPIPSSTPPADSSYPAQEFDLKSPLDGKKSGEADKEKDFLTGDSTPNLSGLDEVPPAPDAPPKPPASPELLKDVQPSQPTEALNSDGEATTTLISSPTRSIEEEAVRKEDMKNDFRNDDNNGADVTKYAGKNNEKVQNNSEKVQKEKLAGGEGAFDELPDFSEEDLKKAEHLSEKPEQVSYELPALEEESFENEELPPPEQLLMERPEEIYLPANAYRRAIENTKELKTSAQKGRGIMNKLVAGISEHQKKCEEFADSLNDVQEALLAMESILER